MNGYNLGISKGRNTLFYIFCGILFGFLAFIYPAAVFYLIAVISVVYFIYGRAEDCERRFLLRIFFYGLTLRIIVSAVMHILSVYYGFGPRIAPYVDIHGGAILGDEIGIHQRAWAMVNMLKGMPLAEDQVRDWLNIGDYGWSFHVYLLSSLYYLFGIVPFLGKCINALFGALTGIIVYFIAKELFDAKTAKLAGILALFSPTLFLWSIVNLKDTILIFLLAFLLYSHIEFLKKRLLRNLFRLVAVLFLIGTYRVELVIPLTFSVLTSVIINVRWNYKKIMCGAIVLALFFNGYFACNYCKAHTESIMKKIKIESFILRHVGYISTGGTINKIYPERFYSQSNPEPISPKETITSLLRGSLSMIFKPLPWEINNRNKLFYYPAGVVWSLLFPFFIIGIFISSRYYFKRNIFLLSMFIVIFILLSLNEGNVGTMIRHRDMITPLYLIFSSFGLICLFSNRRLKAE